MSLFYFHKKKFFSLFYYLKGRESMCDRERNEQNASLCTHWLTQQVPAVTGVRPADRNSVWVLHLVAGPKLPEALPVASKLHIISKLESGQSWT